MQLCYKYVIDDVISCVHGLVLIKYTYAFGGFIFCGWHYFNDDVRVNFKIQLCQVVFLCILIMVTLVKFGVFL